MNLKKMQELEENIHFEAWQYTLQVLSHSYWRDIYHITLAHQQALILLLQRHHQEQVKKTQFRSFLDNFSILKL